MPMNPEMLGSLYPRYKEQIAAFTEEGYSGDEIYAYLNKKEKAFRSEGYSQTEINQYIGRIPSEEDPSLLGKMFSPYAKVGGSILKGVATPVVGAQGAIKDIGELIKRGGAAEPAKHFGTDIAKLWYGEDIKGIFEELAGGRVAEKMKETRLGQTPMGRGISDIVGVAEETLELFLDPWLGSAMVARQIATRIPKGFQLWSEARRAKFIQDLSELERVDLAEKVAAQKELVSILKQRKGVVFKQDARQKQVMESVEEAFNFMKEGKDAPSRVDIATEALRLGLSGEALEPFAKGKIPVFKTTTEAEIFGRQATKKEFEQLKRLRTHHEKKGLALIEEGKKTGNRDLLNEGMQQGFIAKKYEEAIQTYTGEVKPVFALPPKETFTSPRLKPFINDLLKDVEVGEPGGKAIVEGGTKGYSSTYPGFMADRGWSKEEVISALTKGIEGKKLTDRQANIYSAAKEQARDIFSAEVEAGKAMKFRAGTGLVFGVETDEEGRPTYDIGKAVAGTLGVAGAKVLGGKRFADIKNAGKFITKQLKVPGAAKYGVGLNKSYLGGVLKHEETIGKPFNLWHGEELLAFNKQFSEKAGVAIDKLPVQMKGKESLAYDLRQVLSNEDGMINTEGLSKMLKALNISGDPDLAIIGDDDLGKALQAVRKPFWVGKQFEKEAPQMAEIVGKQVLRENKTMDMTRGLVKHADDYLELPKKSRLKVNRALHKGESLFTEKIDDAVLKKDYLLNDKEVKAYHSFRKTVNVIWDDKIKRMVAAEPDKTTSPKDWEAWEKGLKGLKENRTPGYVPHSWYGKFNVAEYDETAELIAIHSFKTKTAARMKAMELNKGKGMAYLRKATEPPEGLYTDINKVWGESIIRKSAVKAGLGQEKINELLLNFQQDMLARGWGRHMIPRKGVKGYEDDLYTPLMDYITGYSGSVTKGEAAVEFHKLFGQLPKDMPELTQFAKDTIKYYLSPDRNAIQNATKKVLFNFFLGANLKQILINSSQQMTAFIPVLSTITKGASRKLGSALDDLIRNNLTQDEFLAFGVVRKKWPDKMGAELLGELSGVKGYPGYEKIKGAKDIANHILRWPMKISEVKINRQPAFLTAYRVFREQGLGRKESVDKAIDIIDVSHYVYGKSNRSKLEQNRVYGGAMVFRSFIINYFEMLANLGRNKQYGSMAKSVGAMTALAGTTGTFGYGVGNFAYKKISGESPETTLRRLTAKHLGDKWGKGAADVILSGLPTSVGIDLSGSIGSGDILFGNMDEAFQSSRAFVYEATKQALGAPFGFTERMMRGATQLTRGDIWKGAESLSPEFIRNPMAAYRLATEGATTFGGKPILDVEGKPLKLDIWEGIFKGIGIQPSRYTRFYQGSQEFKRLMQEGSSLTNYIARKLAMAEKNNNERAWNRTKEEQKEINKQRAKLNLPIIKITREMINTRKRPSVPPRKWKAKEVELRRLYGRGVP